MRHLPLETVLPRLPLVETMPRSYFALGLAYLGAYVLLDWVSYVHPFTRFGITPWNPQTGLSFALILLFGRAYLPWLFVAQLAADVMVRGLPLPPFAEAAIVLMTGLGYGLAALLLRSPRVRLDTTLSSRRSLIWLMAVAIASIAAVSLGHAVVLVAAAIITPAELGQAALHAFVGDLIGVMVFTPFVLIGFTRQQLPTPSWEAVVILLFIVAALWGVFGVAQAFRPQLFYLFFLPIVWIAVRFGLEGVTVGLVVTQIGLITAVELSGLTSADVVSYQALMAVLAVTGLAIGVLVSEQQRTQQQLRMHQDALHRAWRLSTMGEFAATVAHEINQPLTAIGNFAKLAKRAVEQSPPDVRTATNAAGDAIAQVERAGSVVNRLRDFIRVGRIDTRPVAPGVLIAEALAVFRPELERRGIAYDTKSDGNLPLVSADALQTEQVILNLLRNAAEALTSAGRHDGRITIEAAQEVQDRVIIRVTDNGPGLDPDLAGQPITAFATTKLDGLGLGLSLSRSIVEAHGGQLWLDSSPRGMCASFTLPVAARKSVQP